MQAYKTCTNCKRNLPIDCFHREAKDKTGFRAECAECRKEKALKNKVGRLSYMRCTKCKQLKRTREFYKDCHKKTGYSTQCKCCINERNSTRVRRYPARRINIKEIPFPIKRLAIMRSYLDKYAPDLNEVFNHLFPEV